MKQYRITSANFVLPGETGDADAFIDPAELQELKRLAGIPISEDLGDNGAGAVSGLDIRTPQAAETGISSPVGSTTSNLAAERNALMHEFHAQTGTDLWFIINFSKPDITGGKIRDKVDAYLRAHPECLPKQPPGGQA